MPDCRKWTAVPADRIDVNRLLGRLHAECPSGAGNRLSGAQADSARFAAKLATVGNMSVGREIRAEGWCVRLDLSRQVLGMEVPEFEYRWGDGEEEGSTLMPMPPAGDTEPVSAAVLLLKAKQFDDGLYAAVDLAAQRGVGQFAGKESLLRSLSQSLSAHLPDATGAAATLFAACAVGGVSVDVPGALQEDVRALAADFLGDELASKPLGFYTWTPELSAIFRQDRFLQRPLKPAEADDLVRALDRTPGAEAIHAAWRRLNARLTNPPARAELRGNAERRAFLPASRSHEQVLVERLYGNRSVPENFDLMDELIRRVRSGEIDLAPTGESGWYDHQTWSLEPLVVPGRMPEGARLDLGERYRRGLEELFRGALALARETHVKQLAIAMAGCAMPSETPIHISPELTVEPLPSLYARRAASYRFVRSVLEETFGTEALGELHRLTQECPCEPTLADELAFMERLFDGAAATARRELGMEADTNDAADARCFAEWRSGLSSDQDVSRDCRMMVPVFYDLERKKTKVWAFLGWRSTRVDVDYKTVPAVVGIERIRAPDPEPSNRLEWLRRKYRNAAEAEPEEPSIVFRSDRYQFAVPVMAEVYVSRMLNRDEFRAQCDRYGTREAILSSL